MITAAGSPFLVITVRSFDLVAESRIAASLALASATEKYFMYLSMYIRATPVNAYLSTQHR
jgi:hypothetical protein